MFLLEQVVNGFVLGGYYLLIALGLSLIFSVGGVVNLAHGAFYAFGAYVVVETANIWDSARPSCLSRCCRPARHFVRALYPAAFLHRRSDPQPAGHLWARHDGRAVAADHMGGRALVADDAAKPERRGFYRRFSVLALPADVAWIVAAILLGIWLLLQKTAFGRVVRAGIQGRTWSQRLESACSLT